MFKRVAFVSLSMVFLSGVFTQSYSAKKGVNNFTEQVVSRWQRFIYDITDFFIHENFGFTDVSPETEKYVREIQRELGMEHITIRLRRMSRSCMRFMGRENACAIAVPYANTIVLSEEWLNSLPENEKKALVGHELIHIRNKHIYKRFLVLCLIPYLGIFLLGPYCRYQELEADKVPALELNNIDGAIGLMKRFKDLRDPKSRFIIKRAIDKTVKFISYPIRFFLASHPPLSKRIKNLEQALDN